MLKNEVVPLEVSDAIKRLGENIRIARTRRRVRQDDLAKKCNITRKTLYGIENGLPGIAIANVYLVLWTLGLLDSTKALAAPDGDEHGKILEAARQPQRVRDQTSIDNDF